MNETPSLARIGGFQLTIDLFKYLAKNATPIMMDSLKVYADKILAQANIFVPEETHSLMLSGRVEQVGPKTWQVIYGVGGNVATEREPFYAVYVHEIPRNYKKAGSGYKYLTRAVAEIYPEMAAGGLAVEWSNRVAPLFGGRFNWSATDYAGDPTGQNTRAFWRFDK